MRSWGKGQETIRKGVDMPCSQTLMAARPGDPPPCQPPTSLPIWRSQGPLVDVGAGGAMSQNHAEQNFLDYV